MLILSEIWTTNIEFYGNILDNYVLYTDLPLKSKIGGVGIYINKDLKVAVCNNLSISCSDDCKVENLWLKVTKGLSNYIIGGVYRHPNLPISAFKDKLTNSLMKISKNYKKYPCFIFGDFNVNLLQFESNKLVGEYLDILLQYDCVPILTMPTRVTEFSCTLIDHIYMLDNNLNSIAQSSKTFVGNLYYNLSDHYPNYLFLSNNAKFNNLKDRPFRRNFSKENYIKFNEKICSVNWEYEFLACINKNLCFDKFLCMVESFFTECFPLKQISRKEAKDKIWITNSLKTSCKKKSELYKIWLTTKDQSDRKRFLDYSKELAKLIKKTKNEFYLKMFNSGLNSTKKMWSSLNTLLNCGKKKGKSSSIEEILIDNKNIVDSQLISEEFNKYFSSIGKVLENQLPTSHFNFMDYLGVPQYNSIFVEPVSSVEVVALIDGLQSNKASNDEYLNANILKNCKYSLCIPLTLLYNMSLNTGFVPDVFKTAKVIPLYKKGDNRIVSNYRPISLLSVFDKILEKIVYKRVYGFLQKHHILYKNQFGFRENFSTNLALLDVTDICYENLDKGNIVLGLYIDLQKAFDTVNHSILLQKLYHYGIRGSLWNWFKSYLSNRKQYTCIDKTKSSERPVQTGVPQGSCLGPLLFLVYMNDLGSLNDMIKLFADDTNVFIFGKNTQNIEFKANKLLSDIQNWLLANRLSINIDKRCYTLFSTRKKLQDITLKICDTVIKRVSSCKYLGVIIDENLSWKEHIHFVYSKLVKFSAIFYKVRDMLSITCLMQLYFSFVYPHLLFGVEVYANCHVSHLHSLKVLNNKIIWTLLSLNRLTHIELLYKNMNVLPIDKLHCFNILIFVHKFIYNRHLLPEIFHLYFTENVSIHGYNTRNMYNFYMIRAGTIGKSCIKYKGCFLWNKLPDKIKCIKSANIFKKELKHHLLNPS